MICCAAQREVCEGGQVSLGRFVFRFKMVNCCRKATFSSTSSRCGLKLDLAVERRPKIRSNMRERELDSDREIINECAVYGVLRRHCTFKASWGVVFRSVKWVVDWGLAHRDLSGVGAIGIDEIAVWKGHKYLTIVYQIDEGARRMLWVGRDRTEQTLTDFFTMFGTARAAALRYVASDMWKPYLRVTTRFASNAVHVLDRFHIVAKLNKTIDEVRAGEARKLAALSSRH